MSKQILVVEDNPVVVKLVSEILKRKGYFVKTAEDGLSALNILEGYVPDIIFVDLLLPKIDGEMLCRIFQSKAHLKDTYIIILSGIAAEVAIDLEKLGADACIAKGRNIPEHIYRILTKIENDTLRQDPDKTYGYKDIYPREATVGLLRSKQHLEVIIENLADGLIEITLEGIIIFINPSAETFLSVPQDQILGKNIFTFFQKEHHQYLFSLLEKTLGGQKQMDESEPIPLKGRYITLKLFSLGNSADPSCIILFHDVTEREQLNKKLKLLSKTDQLTGAYNRRAFDEFFTKELNTAKRYGEPFSLILLDIDHFKKHNDSFGHNIGDNILKEVVQVINLQMRQVDFLFRWGGDEFVILLPKTDLEHAQVIAERIRSSIETWDFSVPTKITVSLGLSLFKMGDDENTLTNRADVALYRSKNDGRNRVSISID